MKSLFKTVVLWLMLLALPLQGFAASAMACCDPDMQGHGQMQGQMQMQPVSDGSDASLAGDELDAPMDGMETASAAPPSTDHHAGHTSTSTSTATSTSASCAACAAHCAGMAPMPIAATVAGHPAPTSGAIPFRPTASTAFVPGTPERPPQPLPV